MALPADAAQFAIEEPHDVAMKLATLYTTIQEDYTKHQEFKRNTAREIRIMESVLARKPTTDELLEQYEKASVKEQEAGNAEAVVDYQLAEAGAKDQLMAAEEGSEITDLQKIKSSTIYHKKIARADRMKMERLARLKKKHNDRVINFKKTLGPTGWETSEGYVDHIKSRITKLKIDLQYDQIQKAGIEWNDRMQWDIIFAKLQVWYCPHSEC